MKRSWPIFQGLIMLAAFGSCGALFLDNDTKAERREKAKSIHFVKDDSYQEECGSCHLAFLPGFLPRRSWIKLMNSLEDHFGENASLEDKVTKDLKELLVANAADSKKASQRSKRMARLIDTDDVLLRITETPFWKRRHMSIREYVWEREKVKSRSNCEACHHTAAKGRFSEYDVQIPD